MSVQSAVSQARPRAPVIDDVPFTGNQRLSCSVRVWSLLRPSTPGRFSMVFVCYGREGPCLKHSLGAFPCNTTCNSRPCMTSWRPSDNCMVVVVAAPATQFGPHPIVLASSSFPLLHYDTSVRDYSSLGAHQHLKEVQPLWSTVALSPPTSGQTFVFSYLVHLKRSHP